MSREEKPSPPPASNSLPVYREKEEERGGGRCPSSHRRKLSRSVGRPLAAASLVCRFENGDARISMSSPPSLSPARVKGIIPTDVAQRKSGITFRRFPDPKLFEKKDINVEILFCFSPEELGSPRPCDVRGLQGAITPAQRDG